MRLLRRMYDNYDKGEDFSDFLSEDEVDEGKEGDRLMCKKGKKK